MRVSCPECSASLEGTPGANIVCPACMTPFLVPAAARAVREFDLMFADGSVAHGMSRHAIREAVYAGRVTAAAKVRHDGQKWEIIGVYPEFAAVFRLLGDDLGPLAGTRKLAGWRSTADQSSSPPPSVAPPPSTLEIPMPGAPPPPVTKPAPPVRPPPPKPAPPESIDIPPEPGRVIPKPAPAKPAPPSRGGGVPLWALGAGAVAVIGGLVWLVAGR